MENDSSTISKMLCDAAIKGDAALLHHLLESEPFILHRTLPAASTSTNIAALPLHLACMLGHLEFTQVLLSRQPNLLETTDPHDQSSTPLHLACRNGHLELVKYIVSVKLGACFLRDSQGRNPVHVAAANGHCKVLDELLKVAPAAARERILVGSQCKTAGDTILHLCAKHNELNTLKYLVEKVHDKSLLNAIDGDSNTILHITFDNKQLEMALYLLKDKRIKKNVLNSEGLTPMDIYLRQRNKGNQEDRKILRELLKARARVSNRFDRFPAGWFENKTNALLVVASLIATVALQAGINPPGGVWQDDSMPQRGSNHLYTLAQSPSPASNPAQHKAGTSIMAYYDDGVDYKDFLFYNGMGLLGAVSGIVILIVGPEYNALSMTVITSTIVLAVVAMIIAYFLSVHAVSPKHHVTTTFLQRGFGFLFVMAAIVVYFASPLVFGLARFMRKQLGAAWAAWCTH